MIHSHKIQFLLASVNEKKLTNEILNLFDGENNEPFSMRNFIWYSYSETKWKDNWWSKEMIFITNFLRKFNFSEFEMEFKNKYEYVDFLFKKYVKESENVLAKNLYLTEKEIINMSKTMIIGGHGDTSINLLTERYNLKNEINNSCDFIKEFSKDVVFSYPNGGVDDTIINYLEKNGCKLAYTIEQKTLTDLDVIDYLKFPRYDGAQIKF
jgi:hypothetical protein